MRGVVFYWLPIEIAVFSLIIWRQIGKLEYVFSSVTQLCPDSLRPHGLQQARLPCPSPTPGACSNSCPLNQWYHPTILSSVLPFSSCLQSFPASGSFQMSQYWSFSFSISPSNEYSGLISFTILSPCSPRDSQESSSTPQFKIINSLVLSFFIVQLTSIHDYWKNHSFKYTDFCQ